MNEALKHIQSFCQAFEDVARLTKAAEKAAQISKVVSNNPLLKAAKNNTNLSIKVTQATEHIQLINKCSPMLIAASKVIPQVNKVKLKVLTMPCYYAC